MQSLDYADSTIVPRPVLLARLALISAILGLLIFTLGAYLYIHFDLRHARNASITVVTLRDIQLICAWLSLFLNIFATTTAIVALSRNRHDRPQRIAFLLATTHWILLGILCLDHFS
jgi:hypothetical protein